MSIIGDLTYGDNDTIINILEDTDLSNVELRAAIQTAFKRIKALEEKNKA